MRKKKIIPIEAKTFDIEIDWVGKEKITRIIERGVGFQSRIQLMERNAFWLADCLEEAISLPQQKRLLRSRKEGSKVLLFRRKENARG